jgi:hypothetical protein
MNLSKKKRWYRGYPARRLCEDQIVEEIERRLAAPPKPAPERSNGGDLIIQAQDGHGSSRLGGEIYFRTALMARAPVARAPVFVAFEQMDGFITVMEKRS